MNVIEDYKKTHLGIIFIWLVKFAGASLALLILALFLGEGPPNPFKLETKELLLLLCLFGIWFGLVLALWKQCAGGALILFTTTIFLIFGNIDMGEVGKSWVFYAFYILGVLNIFCGWLRKRRLKQIKRRLSPPLDL
ncbi:MAG: hypothetical protein JXA52_00045 [Planctomycetes bacterium]|nr:hypothetical protein [Planctomycetota bacterium]